MTIIANNAGSATGETVIPPIAPVAGKQYLNRKGHRIFLNGLIAQDDPRFAEGYRFQDASGIVYTADGSHKTDGTQNNFDLVSEYVPAVDDNSMHRTTETIVEETKGFFNRVGRWVRRHPTKTTVVVAGTGLVGYGAYNYNEYGTILPPALEARVSNDLDVADRVAAFSSFFANVG